MSQTKATGLFNRNTIKNPLWGEKVKISPVTNEPFLIYTTLGLTPVQLEAERKKFSLRHSLGSLGQMSRATRKARDRRGKK